MSVVASSRRPLNLSIGVPFPDHDGRRCRPGTFLDRRSDLVVIRVIEEHARVGQEVVLGIRGVSVADEEVRDEVDLRFRSVGNASVREFNPTR